MKVIVTLGKKGKVKIGESKNLSDIVDKVEQHAKEEVPFSNISVNGEYAEYQIGDKKIVTISDEDILKKIKTLVKTEADLKTNSFEMEIVKEGK